MVRPGRDRHRHLVPRDLDPLVLITDRRLRLLARAGLLLLTVPWLITIVFSDRGTAATVLVSTGLAAWVVLALSPWGLTPAGLMVLALPYAYGIAYWATLVSHEMACDFPMTGIDGEWRDWPPRVVCAYGPGDVETEGAPTSVLAFVTILACVWAVVGHRPKVGVRLTTAGVLGLATFVSPGL